MVFLTGLYEVDMVQDDTKDGVRWSKMVPGYYRWYQVVPGDAR